MNAPTVKTRVESSAIKKMTRTGKFMKFGLNANAINNEKFNGC